MTETVHKVRVSRKIQEFLEGTQIWADLNSNSAEALARENASSVSMMRKVRETNSRADGSVMIELDEEEAHSLYSYTDAMYIGARDNANFNEPWTTAEMNAGRALLDKLVKLYGTQVMR